MWNENRQLCSNYGWIVECLEIKIIFDVFLDLPFLLICKHLDLYKVYAHGSVDFLDLSKTKRLVKLTSKWSKHERLPVSNLVNSKPGIPHTELFCSLDVRSLLQGIVSCLGKLSHCSVDSSPQGGTVWLSCQTLYPGYQSPGNLQCKMHFCYLEYQPPVIKMFKHNI